MSFVHSFDPVLLNLGPLEIRYYGLVYVLAFVIGYFYFDYLIKKGTLRMTKDELYDLILYLMIGVLLGGRLVHCLVWEPSYYLTQPWKILYLWQGGMAFHGGLLGVFIATYLFWRREGIRKKIPFLRLGDHLSIVAVLMLAAGRIANFLNGELPGRVTDVSWCWYFPGYEGCRHPQQLYSAVKRFVVFFWLVWLSRGKYKDGFVFWNMMFLMGIGRFVIDFYRDDYTIFSLTAGQYLSIIMIAIGAYALVKYHMHDIKKVFSGRK